MQIMNPYANYVQNPMSNNMHDFNIKNASSDTNRAYMFSHTSALPQSQLPMYNQQGQTNMMSSASFYETSRHNNFANMQQGVSHFSSSVTNCQYSLPQISIPMIDQHGQISGTGSADYFNHSCTNNFSHPHQEVPLSPSATFSTHLVTQQILPMDSTYDRNNNRLEEGVPFGCSSLYAIPNGHDSATFANHGRVSISPTPPQIADEIPFGSFSETHLNDQRVLQVDSTSSQSMAERHLEPKSSRGQSIYTIKTNPTKLISLNLLAPRHPLILCN
jgi:hypothetical protein